MKIDLSLSFDETMRSIEGHVVAEFTRHYRPVGDPVKGPDYAPIARRLKGVTGAEGVLEAIRINWCVIDAIHKAIPSASDRPRLRALLEECLEEAQGIALRWYKQDQERQMALSITLRGIREDAMTVAVSTAKALIKAGKFPAPNSPYRWALDPHLAGIGIDHSSSTLNPEFDCAEAL